MRNYEQTQQNGINYWNKNKWTLSQWLGKALSLQQSEVYVSFVHFRLSGESPFQGNSDAETLALVTAAQFDFDEESFEDISDEAQDFISSLLQKDPKSVIVFFFFLLQTWIICRVSIHFMFSILLHMITLQIQTVMY